MTKKFSPEMGINIFFLFVTAAAPTVAFQNITVGLVTGIPMGLGLWAVLLNSSNNDSDIRNYYLFGGWAIRAFAVAIEQMAYLNVMDKLQISQLPFGWSEVAWAWIFPCFTGCIDLWVHYTRAKVTAKIAEEEEYQRNLSELRRKDEEEKEKRSAAERHAAELKAAREKREAAELEAAQAEARRVEELRRTNPKAANIQEWKKKISEAEAEILSSTGVQPTQKQLAAKLGVTDRTIRNYQNAPNGQADN